MHTPDIYRICAAKFDIQVHRNTGIVQIPVYALLLVASYLNPTTNNQQQLLF